MNSFSDQLPEHLNDDQHQANEPGQEHSAWSVPWSDLMMVMFVLFAVLFIYSANKRDVADLFQKSGESMEHAAESEGESGALASLARAISGLGAVGGQGSVVYEKAREIVFRSGDGAVTTAMEPDGSVRVVMRGGVFFSQNSKNVSPAADEYLAEVAELLNMGNHRVLVVGHADGSESRAGGLDVSTGRALSVVHRLVDKHAIDPDRFTVSGRGGSSPQVPDAAGRTSSDNRRVEIIILVKDIMG